jgi:hypothetical protein
MSIKTLLLDPLLTLSSLITREILKELTFSLSLLNDFFAFSNKAIRSLNPTP